MGRVSNEVPDVLKQDEVTIDQIMVDDSKNMRTFPISEKEMKELAADIAANGQLQPVIVRPATQNGYKYELVGGYRRFHAIESLVSGGTDMTILVRVIEAEDLGAMVANIAENIKRKDASVIELAHAIGKLKDGESVRDEEGSVTVTRPAMTLREISQSLGVSLGKVSETERMRSLRPAIQKKIHNGDISGDVARQLIKMSEDEQDAALAKIESGEVSQGQLAQAAKAKNTGKKKRKGKGKGDENGDEGGNTKRPLSAKAALLVLDELCDVPKAGEGDEPAPPPVESDTVRGILAQFGRFMAGKIGAKALVNQITKLVEE
jgi:ParB/RepB/Spo0J family partition protein